MKYVRSGFENGTPMLTQGTAPPRAGLRRALAQPRKQSLVGEDLRHLKATRELLLAPAARGRGSPPWLPLPPYA